ncbi:oligopeptide transport ATP-binding protein OppD [Oxobacter pfennigii]|uniref:Oligopeptide transport ATP-binding protein OppD n=1 Tax=Oxobacter pfennigii TaxID=36849 RepID=A0A0P8YXF3_9CLOT|nr:ABC transporter ATP-binding protein [Oxobacter pfennigii]KPU44417.1 oligopeptide transport ATP-binding protein OppD [Oxobacter pfennigii]
MNAGNALLKIKDLNVSYGEKPVVKLVDMEVGKKQIAVIVGESGSGKSTLLRSIIGLLGENGTVSSGEIMFNERDLRSLCHEEFRKIRGHDISMIFQNPECFFDPGMRAGKQFYEFMKMHQDITKTEARELAHGLLIELKFSDPERVLRSYPFELSGGMCQRLAIAFAMANRPKLILADEPTSSLDVTVQAEIINLMLQMYHQYDTSMLFVTHNMAIVAKLADMVGVMYRGRIVEWGTKEEVLYGSQHPYTQVLLKAVPKFKKAMAEAAIHREGYVKTNFKYEALPVMENSHEKKYFSHTHWSLAH